MLFVLTGLPSAQGGGSVTFKEVRSLLDEAALQHLESAYSIDEIGVGVRLGRHYSHLGGARVAPYEFLATASAATGLAFSVTIHAEVVFLDAAGKPTEDPKLAVEVRETFQGYDIVLKLDAAGATDVPPSLPAPATEALSDAERQRVVEDVRAVYAEVEATDLESESSRSEVDEIAAERVRSFSSDGTVRRVAVSIGAGDHGGFGLEIQCDRQAIPRFVLWQAMYWQFVSGGEGKTMDHVTERRFYFSAAGQLAKSLEKDYQGSDEADLRRNQDAAKNRDFVPQAPGVAAFLEAVKKIVTCSDAEVVGAVQDLIDGQRLMVGEG